MYKGITTENAAIGEDLQNWMTLLPESLRNVPVTYLAIPGSHDSATYSIRRSSGVSPDALPYVQQLAKVLGPLVKIFVYNWSVTQHAPIQSQLKLGIRYFDLRLATQPGTKDVFIVHSQYGMSIESLLQEMKTFLADHEEEIVILDFQHFYSFTKESHSHLMTIIDSFFGKKLCPLSHSVSNITLKFMSDRGYQIIAIYRNDAAKGIPTFWPTSRWPTPWPETTSLSTMFSYLEEKLSMRPPQAGFVTQCVLTPDVKFFLRHVFSSLEKQCATPCNRAIIPWLQRQRPGSKGINVVICDFVDMKNVAFCQTVVQLNAKLLDEAEQ